MAKPMNLGTLCLATSLLAAMHAANAVEQDIRRDAIMIATERVAPAVVNIATERIDLALVKVSREKPFPFVPLARDSDVLLGETVLAIGNPFGFGNSVTHGIISSKDRTAVDNRGNVVVEGVLQTDAAINPGNS